jgi:streptogramin lyase
MITLPLTFCGSRFFRGASFRSISRLFRLGLGLAGGLLATCAFAQINYDATPYTVTTLAGTAEKQGSANGTGSAASFTTPAGVAVDSAGNVYVADTGNNTIRKITASGIVTTLAGTAGIPGSADGTGTAAQFRSPTGAAVDGAGNLYVADSGNQTIRKITPTLVSGVTTWVVTTVAGSAGTTGSADGTGTAASFNNPTAVAVDSADNLYLTDEYNYTIRKITPTLVSGVTTWVVTTIAGSAGNYGNANGTGTAAGFYLSAGVAVDSAGNVYVADTYNYTIRKITPTVVSGVTTWVVTTLAGQADLFVGSGGTRGDADGTGGGARFNLPYGVAVDEAGNVYVADTYNNTIRKITSGGVVTTVAGGGPTVTGSANGTGSAASFDLPFGVAVDSTGNLYVADTGNSIIREVSPPVAAATIASTPYAFTTFAGTAGQPGSTDSANGSPLFSAPTGVAVDGLGNAYVSDTVNDTIREISPTGVVTTIAGTAGSQGTADGTGGAAFFNGPSGVAVDSAGNLYVADTGNDTIREITPTVVSGVTTWVVTTIAGQPEIEGTADGTGSAAGFYHPFGVAVDSAGNVYVADTGNNTIREITPTVVSGITTWAVTTLAGMATIPQHVDGTGTGARFAGPHGVAVDSTGNLYVADLDSDTIRKITPTPLSGVTTWVVTTLAGTGYSGGSSDGAGGAAQFFDPESVAVDSAGNVYVADTGNDTIRGITPAGVVTTLAGTAGSPGSANGTGGAARFDKPIGVAVDGAGNLYVADSANDTIRKGTPTGEPAITEQPQSQTFIAGSDVVLVVASSGDSPLSYQWEVSKNSGTTFTDLTDGSGVSGSTTATLTLTGATAGLNGYQYECVITNGVSSVTTTPATLTLAGAPAITPYTFTTLAGMVGSEDSLADGTGSAALFYVPIGLAVDGSGNIYVADTANNAIRMITPAGMVTTIAGAVNLGDGFFGTGEFNGPQGIAVDSAGNLYVADTGNDTIRKITPPGAGGTTWAVSTLAGSAGQPGSTDSANGSPLFNGPTGVAVDGAGNVYVADQGNNMIRKIAPTGVVTTIAGTAGSTGSANGMGSAALFDGPSGVAVDSTGNLYVADFLDDTIRKITPAGVVTTLAGTAGQAGGTDGTSGAARFNTPYGVAVDSAGDVYVADQGNNTIRAITPAGVVTTIGGTAGQVGSADGTGGAAQFFNPHGVAVDSADNLYVADSDNDTIRKGIPASELSITEPASQTVGVGSNAVLTVAASGSSALSYQWEVSSNGETTWTDLKDGNGISGSTNATLTLIGAAAGLNGYQYECVVTDSAASLATIPVTLTVNAAFPATTYTFTTLAGTAGQSGSTDSANGGPLFGNPSGLAMDSSGNVFVADTLNDTIREITPAGVVSTIAGTAGQVGSTDGTGSAALFNGPQGVTVDASGNVYVADSNNYTIRKITPTLVSGVTTWAVTTLAGTAGEPGHTDSANGSPLFDSPTGVAVDSSGNVYVADTYNETIREITPAGGVTTIAGTTGSQGSVDGMAATAQFAYPKDVAVDSAGNLYVADFLNDTIRKITPTPGAGGTTWAVSTFAGTPNGNGGSADGTGAAAQFYRPIGVAVDSTGNVYVADYGNDTIRKITPARVVTTLGGIHGQAGSADGIGSAARFNLPFGVAVDSTGNLYVADTGNSTIREGTPASDLSIATQPKSQTVNAGSDVVLAVGASGSSPLSYQWYLNGSPIAGAMGPTLSLSNVQTANDGAYQVEVTDRSGNETPSNSATLMVTVPVTPSGVISSQPVSQTINNGSNVVFTITANGSVQSSVRTGAILQSAATGATTYQWQFNGVDLTDGNGISGSTGPQLFISEASSADDGDYACVVTTGGVASQSNSAGLIVAATSNPGIATSISTRAFVGTGDNILIGGFYIVGSTSRTVLVQGLGPALTPLGVTGALAHPELTIHQSQNGQDVTLYSNIGWSTNTGAAEQQVLLAAAATAFATPVLSVGSADSELLLTLPPGGYSAEVSGANGGTGVALCAIYELP